jgi:soluble lytic murein transglycosylase-like protein
VILKRALFPLLAGCAALSGVPVQADVLEVGDTGQARWVAGPLVAAAQVTQATLVEVPASAGGVPEHAIANPASHTGNIPARYALLVAQLSARYDLSPALIEAVVWQESRWRENAVSPKGARGLAQLMPGTARDLGVDPDDPAANLEGGARYLREQLNRFDGDLELALAAYNAGPGRVERARGIPKIRETQAYVASVMGRLSNHSRSSE